MRVHHIGYFVKNIEKAAGAFSALGYTVQHEVVWDEARMCRIAFLEAGGVIIELIQPDAVSQLFPLFKRYQNAPYHICYCCENLEDTVRKLREARWLPFLEPAPAPAIGETARVVFCFHAQAGMIELVEQKSEENN